ncbi:MAG: cysteine--tRNA ligase [Candidatus Wildermuthbacteria bacterium]|nr:cysteine--tRNA ligase [Candidatus Wildermuthbacteria bacterium]
MKVSNTLSRRKENLRPRKNKEIHLFVCGPTVYDFSHIGHARTYIAFDVIVKYLRSIGFRVEYLQNITDVDDKIINRAKELDTSHIALAEKFEKDYRDDMKTLKVDSVSRYARATRHIKEIIGQIQRLLQKGYAYEITGDGIYYDISRFKRYGKLSGRTSTQAEDAISRIDESIHKRNKGDFALWKLTPRSPKGEVGFVESSWPSPWGKGRPGWHIEDTAITEKYFGPQYDIHGGARDLLFPHHEAEIAQMEALSGKRPMAKYWLHTGFLTIHGEKMSKSLGNFITIRDFTEKYSARLLRFLVLKTHYRSPIDYSEEMVEQARHELARIDEFVGKLHEKSEIRSTKHETNSKLTLKFKKDFTKAMEDDFNTPIAIASLFQLINQGNIFLDKDRIGRTAAKALLDFFQEIDTIFGFIFWRERAAISPDIKQLIREREEYRKKGNWEKADELRAVLKTRGWTVEDTATGPKIKKSP